MKRTRSGMGGHRRGAGSNGAGSSGGVRPRTRAARSAAVPGAVVTPRPSWPAATHRPGSHVPTSGSLSGVAGRKPAQRAQRAQARERGQVLGRAAQHPAARAGGSASRPSPPARARSRRAAAPSARGWTLKATDSRVRRVRALQVAELDQLVAQDAGVAVGDHEVALARDDRQAGRERAGPGPGGVHDDGRPRATGPPHARAAGLDRRDAPARPDLGAARAAPLEEDGRGRGGG